MRSSSICEKSPADLHAALRQWYVQGPGQRLLAVERALLSSLSEDVFGYHLVQLQDYGHGLDSYQNCHIKHRSLLDQAGLGGSHLSAWSASEQLPVANDTVDLVALPHTLDFAFDPQQVLRETERILIPEGRLLILGFNPLSLWGVQRLLLGWRGQIPWCGHFLSYRRLLDWLGLLGFDIEYTDVAAWVPPLSIAARSTRISQLDEWGRRMLPMVAGVYAVRAVKRVSTIRPLKPRWMGLRVFGPRVIEPSTRNGINKVGNQ